MNIGIQGHLKHIDEFKRLHVTIDEKTYDDLLDVCNKKNKKLTDRVPLYKTSAGLCVAKLNLHKFDKPKARSYEAHVGKYLTVAVNINRYESDSIGAGVCLEILRFKVISEAPAAVQPVGDSFGNSGK